MHALATQQSAEAIRIETNRRNRDELAVSALLHDVGKVVLLDAYDSYAEIRLTRGTPEQRLALERAELGVDHAMTGAAVARRLGLPARLTATIAGHHGGGQSPEAAIVRLADMLARFQIGHAVEPRTLESVAHEVGLPDRGLRSLLYSVHGPADTGARAFDPSPLSRRQHEILRLLAVGKANKEIARELGLTPSTVRSHQHSIYTKLDVADRAQAVLLASRRGWI
jgi:putative nucleotidyltransferase with HDIG domain